MKRLLEVSKDKVLNDGKVTNYSMHCSQRYSVLKVHAVCVTAVTVLVSFCKWIRADTLPHWPLRKIHISCVSPIFFCVQELTDCSLG